VTATPRSRVRTTGGLLAALAGLGLAVLPTAGGGTASASSLGGSAGVAGGLPLTSSAVTDRVGSGPFTGLKVTVDQTTNLINQAVSVTWTGAPSTWSSQPGSFLGDDYAADYLQIFQCWSANAATAPTAEQCEFGGENSNQSTYPVVGLSNAYDRVISQPGWDNFTSEKEAAAADPSCSAASCTAYLDPNSGYVLEPFDAVDGTVVPASVDYNYANFVPYKAFDTNPYFSYTTTNEVDFARTFPNGTGETLFQVDTGDEAPGLGCGERALPGNAEPQCWLVLVPRSTPAGENDPADPDQTTVDTSPLSSAAWANHIAVPLDFDPVGAGCSIAAKPAYISGGEPAQVAVANWQPALCATPGDPPYDYEAGPEDSARQATLGSAAGGPGMAVISRPIDPSLVSPTDPVVYAPLTLSGITIAFNIERVPQLDTQGQPLPDEAPLAGTGVTHLNLTPRLVAKLLTESYKDQFYGRAPTGSKYAWLDANPSSLLSDPDFLRYNPEFAELQSVQGWDDGSLVVEAPDSDSAYELWQWILADPSARAWLDGEPDPWGMRVNPYYTINPKLNPTGFAVDNPPLESYPKDDPYCWNPPAGPSYEILTGQVARRLCFLDWSPYVGSMQAAAQATLVANDGGKATFNQGVTDPNAAWAADGPQVVGQDFIMSVTDSANAARYGLQTASLSRAGDDGPDPTFVSPTSASLLAGLGAMVPSSVSGVLQPDSATIAPAAYPLPLLTYAAVAPLGLPQAERQDYARFIDYAAGAGQVPGTAIGDLPAGYVPLPGTMRAADLKVAAAVLHPPVVTSFPSTTRTGSTPTQRTTPTEPAVPRQGTAIGLAAVLRSAAIARALSAAGSVAQQATPMSDGFVHSSPAAIPAAETALIPVTAIGLIKFSVPIAAGVGLLALLGVPVAGRFRRRRPTLP